MGCDEAFGIGRRRTRPVYKGAVQIGGGAPVSVQSMTTTETRRVDETVRQARRLARAGCDIVRVAVPTMADARAVREIVERVKAPIVADIHFNPKLAIASIEAGAHCVRINPGNLGGLRAARGVFDAAKAAGISVRIGVNSGSIRGRRGVMPVGRRRTAKMMAERLLAYAHSAEKRGLDQLVLSAKSADVAETIDTNRLVARQTDWPIHLGVTAAGPPETALVRNAVGLGILLADGIGDTVRVSMTGDPVDEVLAGREILASLGLGGPRAELISCPTCGRCKIDLIKLARKVRRRLAGVRVPLKVAVMGCVVNGPGEAAEADVGIAGGKGRGLLFRRGRKPVSVPEGQLAPKLFEAIDEMIDERLGTA